MVQLDDNPTTLSQFHPGRRRHLAHHRGLDRADIGDDGAGLEMASDFFRDRAAGADGDAEDHEIGILDRLRIALDHGIDDAELPDPRPDFERAVVTISLASPCARAARAIDVPISPKPIRAIFSNDGAPFTSRP